MSQFQEIPTEEDENEIVDVENLDALIRSVQALKERDAPPQVRSELRKIPEVLDDFIRNYFVTKGLTRTLSVFESEWYENFGAEGDTGSPMPEVYVELARALDETAVLRGQLEKSADAVKKLNQMLESARRERDFHRANHGRVVQEKEKLSADIRGLQSHAASIDPMLNELRSKYEGAQKEKMLLRLERDKLLSRVSALEEQLRDAEKAGTETTPVSAAVATKTVTKRSVDPTLFQWPSDNRPLPQLAAKTPGNPFSWSCRSAFKAHSLAVTHVALHPRKAVVASSSDDGTWRLMSLPQGDLIMSGEGHKDWIAGIAMHPKGTMVATASGDKTIKLWDFGKNACKATLKAHTEGVWCVDFHDTGDLLASGSLDHSVRVWDTDLAKCRQTLRGHVDAVNSVMWVPGSNTICTGSGDKTVSIWDARANYCVQTFYGHRSAVTSVSISPSVDSIASCDTEGNVIVWDIRLLNQRAGYSCGPHPANSVVFDRSGQLLAVGCEDSSIRMISLIEEKQATLKGHEDAVQHAIFDPQTNGFLVSCGSDATVRYWS